MNRSVDITANRVKESQYKDENIVKGEYPKGDRSFMSLTADAFKEKPAAERHPRISSTANQAKSNFLNRYNIELILYWISKAAVIALTALILSAIYDGGIEIRYWPALFIVSISAYLVSSMRLPAQKLTPLRRKRIDAGWFLSREIKFILLNTAVAFFSGMNISPATLSLFLGINLVMQSGLFILWRMYNLRQSRAQNIRPRSHSEKNVIIFGTGKRGKKAADMFLRYPDLNVRVLGFVDFHREGLWRYRDIPLVGYAGQLNQIINGNQVDAVVMAPEPEDYADSQQVFELVEEMGVDLCVLPFIYDRKISRCCASSVNGQPMLLYRPVKHSRYGKLAKEIMDKIGALAGLTIAAPVLIVSAIAIKIDSHGPVFFKQKRSGLNGRTFEMLKLRTMVADADRQKEKLRHLNEMSGPVFKIRNDPRVTRVGRILRKFSIDEFPQFINILKGDMSLVGPRPPLPTEVAEYEPWQRRKLSVKPGATCLWQINGRNSIDFERWTKLDLQYIDQWSLKEDARILAKTFPAVLKGNGAS